MGIYHILLIETSETLQGYFFLRTKASKFTACLSIHFMEIHQVALTVPGRMAAPGAARLETDIHRAEAQEGTADTEAQGWRPGDSAEAAHSPSFCLLSPEVGQDQ